MKNQLTETQTYLLNALVKEMAPQPQLDLPESLRKVLTTLEPHLGYLESLVIQDRERKEKEEIEQIKRETKEAEEVSKEVLGIFHMLCEENQKIIEKIRSKGPVTEKDAAAIERVELILAKAKKKHKELTKKNPWLGGKVKKKRTTKSRKKGKS